MSRYIDSYEKFDKLQEKLSLNPEWAKVESATKQKLLDDIHEDLANEMVNKAAKEIDDENKPKKSTRAPRKKKNSDE